MPAKARSADTRFKAKLAELSRTFKAKQEIMNSPSCDRAIAIHLRLKIANQLAQLARLNKEEKL